jgi:hypothetical protein
MNNTEKKKVKGSEGLKERMQDVHFNFLPAENDQNTKNKTTTPNKPGKTV